ncbi:aminotransferase class V-fold PLP-dependent enzyme [Corynebacterium lubricantis]|uniref:aminotransferase class V-fold PLP-dependent enzyme n=1 Tax=Corynebacterium lubricantis TaxID=541095 RepID=UPI00036597BD|nr:aminotransferase class V-fold PLP-dependent enzyme [Corynebacterium lubricantis]
MAYDVFEVRGLYTSLSDGWTYLNAHDCPQIPERVSAAVARSFRMATQAVHPEVKTGTHSRSSVGRPEGDAFAADARHAIADLVGSSANRVVLGPSLPVLYAALASAMRPMFRHHSSIVVSSLEDAALTVAFKGLNSDIRWAQPDLATGDLPAWQYGELVDGGTRLVSIPAAHSALGNVVDVQGIAERAREKSRAWVLVDATAYAAHRVVDLGEMGSDIVAVDIGALGGPQVAALVFRDEAMFKRLESLNPALGKQATGIEKLSLDVAPGLAGGVSPLVEHVSNLVPVTERMSRRNRVVRSMTELGDYLDSLRDDLYGYLGALPSVHIVGASGEAAQGTAVDRLPRLSFGVRGVPAETVYRRLVDNGLITTVSKPSPLFTEMGVDEIGGAVTVALGPFNTESDIEHLTRVVASLA